MSRILVTGGAGFIGSHVVDQLIDAGHEPIIYDLRDSQYHDRVRTVIGDLANRRRLTAAMSGCDAVIHLAAAADVGEVLNDPAGAERANSHGTAAVLEAARATRVGRVVYCSTIWVYGDAEGLVTEESGLELPRHLYTATKLAGEMYCTSYAELYEVDCTILRFGIPYGPRARPAAVVPQFIAKALAGEPLTIAGDGSQSRRFVYVEDLAAGVVSALRPAAANRVYNLVGTESVTIREVADVVRDVVAPVEIVHTPGRSGDFDGAEISSERAASELDWTASTCFRDGVDRYLRWHQAENAAASKPEPDRRPAQVATLAPVMAAVVACGLGILVPAILAARLHPLGEQRMHTVAFVVLVAVAAALVPGLRRDVRPVAASLIAAGGALLVILPWTRHALELAPPGLGGLLFGALGVTIAMATVVASRRVLAGSRPAPETAI